MERKNSLFQLNQQFSGWYIFETGYATYMSTIVGMPAKEDKTKQTRSSRSAFLYVFNFKNTMNILELDLPNIVLFTVPTALLV